MRRPVPFSTAALDGRRVRDALQELLNWIDAGTRTLDLDSDAIADGDRLELVKADGTRYTVTGAELAAYASAGSGLPIGGTTGQALIKNSNASQDAGWSDVVNSFAGRDGAVTPQSGDYSASDVGLGSVTNDPQLKRSAGDFATFASKPTPVSADVLLIEDSAASGAKKRVTIASLPAGGVTSFASRTGAVTPQSGDYGASDVGLGNVTNDSQLKRAASDFATFTSKATPTGTDVLLIEDTAAAGAKKRITISSLPNSGVTSFEGRAGAVTSQAGDYTAAEVGLGSVTNDAQLKRAAGDFSTFASKATPVGADVLLIEDSAASGAKKLVTISSLPNGGVTSFEGRTGAVTGQSGDYTAAEVGLGSVTNDAQLKRAAGDFSTFASKAVPVGADVLLIEDSAASGAKKLVTISSLPVAGVASFEGRTGAVTSQAGDYTAAEVGLGSVTNDAQLKRAAGDFATFATKAVPVGADVLLIEDSAAAGAKKLITISSLPIDGVVSFAGRTGVVTPQSGDYNAAAVGLGNVTNDAQLKRADSDFATFALKATPVGADVLLIEDSAAAGAKRRIAISSLPGGGVTSFAGRTGAVTPQSGDYTAATVGLGSVTNDAQLKRAAGDFSTFTSKPTPVGADVLLIEDSAAAGAKKFVTVSSLQGGFKQTAVLASAFTIAGTALADVTGFSIAIPSAGTYAVRVRGVVNCTATSTQGWSINYTGTFSALSQSFIYGNAATTFSNGASTTNNSATGMTGAQAAGGRPLYFDATVIATGVGNIVFRAQRSVATVTLRPGTFFEVVRL